MSFAIPTLHQGLVKPATSAGFSAQPELGDWVSRVQSVGSDVSAPTQTAVGTFIVGLKTDGIWDKLKRLNIYAGDSISASMAPLKNLIGTTTESFQNFVTGDYNETQGLTGNSSSKAILTGINPSASFMSNTSSIHCCCYIRNAMDTNGLNTANVGGQQSGVGNVGLNISYRASSLSNTIWDSYNSTTGRISVADSNGRGFYVGTRVNTTSSIVYKNGAVLAATTGSAGTIPSVSNTAIHAQFDSVQNVLAWAPQTYELYSIGTGLTEAEIINYYTRYNTLRTSLGRVLTGSSDPDVADWIQRVIEAGSAVTSGSTVSAVETFVAGLKSDGIWNKIKRLNIYAGNDLNALKAPLKIDAGAAFDTLTNFVAADYTSSVGLTGNTTTKYINTGCRPDDGALGDNDNHLALFARTIDNTDHPTMGTQNGVTDSVLYVAFSGTTYYDSNDFTTGRIAVADTNGTGSYIGSRSGSAAQALYKNGVLFGSNTGAAGNRSSQPFFVHALNNSGTPYQPTARTIEMYSIGLGLSAADATNYFNRYMTLRTALGR